MGLHDILSSCLFVYIIIFWQLKFCEGRGGGGGSEWLSIVV